MSTCISYQDQFFYISNQEFARLLEFAVTVAGKGPSSTRENEFVCILRKRSESLYPGCDFEIEKEFPSSDHRKFWARVFFDLGYLIFRREIGTHDATYWQYSSVGNAYLLARILTRSVQNEEIGWYPKTMASIEADIFHNKGINVQL